MSRPLQAVLLDVDGTLYHQPALRAFMAAELAWSFAARGPARALRDLRLLRIFRHERERLRLLGRPAERLEDAQYARAAAVANVEETQVRAVVEDWIYRRPLKYLRRVARSGCQQTLSALAAQGLRIGVLSDYPTADKVEALGLTGIVSLQLCATDTTINAFKPHPAGFLEACRRWAVDADRVAYVGDRVDVDVAGAREAGMRAFVIGRQSGDGFSGAPTFEALGRVLGGCSA